MSKTNTKAEYYRELAKKNVWVPCRKEEDGSMSLQLLVSEQGERFIPAFFAKESETGQFPKSVLVSLPFPVLRHTILELPDEIRGIAVEPFGENTAMNREQLQEYDSFIQGMSTERRLHPGNLIMTVPERLPKGLKQALKAFFDKQLSIREAWILLAREETEIHPHLLVLTDFSGSKIDLFPKLAEVIKPYMKPGQSFELMQRQPGADMTKFEKGRVYRRRERKGYRQM